MKFEKKGKIKKTQLFKKPCKQLFVKNVYYEFDFKTYFKKRQVATCNTDDSIYYQVIYYQYCIVYRCKMNY